MKPVLAKGVGILGWFYEAISPSLYVKTVLARSEHNFLTLYINTQLSSTQAQLKSNQKVFDFYWNPGKISSVKTKLTLWSWGLLAIMFFPLK